MAKEKNGIGYGGAAYAKGVEELKVKVGSDELAPTAENIKSGKYPLSRDLFFYLRGKPAGEAKAFIDFALSPEGQADREQGRLLPGEVAGVTRMSRHRGGEHG